LIITFDPATASGDFDAISLAVARA